MANYKFLVLNPVGKPEIRAAELAKLAAASVLGIEITIPELAKGCLLGNIDPQHGEQNVDQAAIEVALTWSLPIDGSTLATVRADMDSVGAMAVMEMRATILPQREADHNAWHQAYSGDYDDCPFENYDNEFWHRDEKSRIAAIANADKMSSGNWPGIRPLPAPRSLPAITRNFGIPAGLPVLISDFKVPLLYRVQTMIDWIQFGTAQGLDSANKAAQDAWNKLVRYSRVFSLYGSGRNHNWFEYEVCSEDNLALCGNHQVATFVSSNQRGATDLGYHDSPVVIAMSDRFSFQGNKPGRKYTICQWPNGGPFVDLKAVLTDLQALEPGWGGSPTIIGSPQGDRSKLQPQQVVDVVIAHLLWREAF